MPNPSLKANTRYLILGMSLYPDYERGGAKYTQAVFEVAKKHCETRLLTLRYRLTISEPSMAQVRVPWVVPLNPMSIRFALAYLLYIIRGMRLVIKWRPDVIHAANVYEAVIPIIMGRKFVTTIHDDYPFIVGKYGRLLAFASLARASTILTGSRWFAEYLQRLSILKRHKRIRVCILSNYVSDEEFSWLQSKSSSRGEPSGSMTVLYVGAILAVKGVGALIRAFADIDNNLTLKMVGPPQEPELIQNLPTNVRYLGVVNRAKLLELFAESYLVILPSIGREGLGMVILEAMAAAKPLIVGNLAVYREVAGDAALYVNGDDPLSIRQAVIKLTKDVILYNKMRTASRVRIFDYTEGAFDRQFSIALAEALRK